jgi:HK97 family phage major capsid protein
MGIINSPALITQDAEGAQAADTLLAENCLKIRQRRLPGYRYTWVYNGTCFSELSSMVLAGTNAPAFIPIGGMNSRPYDTLLGDPIFETEHASKLGDKGDLLYGAWDQYLITERAGGVRADTSIHCYFSTAETAFRFLYRADGMPALPAPVTLEQSASIVSTFVTLAARA